MTTKQIQKLKTPKLIQQVESTLKPLEFLDRCAKNYGDIFITNSFGNLETLVVSHPQDIQELFNPKIKFLMLLLLPMNSSNLYLEKTH